MAANFPSSFKTLSNTLTLACVNLCTAALELILDIKDTAYGYITEPNDIYFHSKYISTINDHFDLTIT